MNMHISSETVRTLQRSEPVRRGCDKLRRT